MTQPIVRVWTPWGLCETPAGPLFLNLGPYPFTSGHQPFAPPPLPSQTHPRTHGDPWRPFSTYPGGPPAGRPPAGRPPDGRHPRRETPPPGDTPAGRHPRRETPPPGDTPAGRHPRLETPPPGDTPRRETPSWETPLGRHPWGDTPEGRGEAKKKKLEAKRFKGEGEGREEGGVEGWRLKGEGGLKGQTPLLARST